MGTLDPTTFSPNTSTASLKWNRHTTQAATPMFRYEEDGWSVTYDGTDCRLPSARGPRLLAKLLRQPGIFLRPSQLEANVNDDAECIAGIKATIESTLKEIATRHYTLGLHLRATIKLGRTCAYVPDPRVPIVWQIADAIV